MRTITADETAKRAGSHAFELRVSLENADGVEVVVSGGDTKLNSGDHLVGVTVGEDVESQGLAGEITLKRSLFKSNVSPLMDKSPVNHDWSNPASTTKMLVGLYRHVRIEYALVASDSKEAPTWTTICYGRIDKFRVAEGENLVIEYRDAIVAELEKAYFEREIAYGLTPSAYGHQRGLAVWAPAEKQAANDLVCPRTLNGFLYRCTAVTTGNTGSTEPVWPTTIGSTVTDSGVTWQCDAATATAGTVSMETVLQQMLNDAARIDGTTAYTLYAPDASSFLMNPWFQQRQPVLEALRAVAILIGWDVRPRWDNGTSTNRLTLCKPDRAITVAMATLTDSDWKEVTQLDSAVEWIRNVYRLVYSDPADLGSDGKTPKRKYRTDKDDPSITAYGRRFAEIAEDATSQITTSAEADAMIAAMKSDLATPAVEFGVDAYFFPWVQLNDYYQFNADGELFDTDQKLAIVGYSHDISFQPDGTRSISTSMSTRGKPSIGPEKWYNIIAKPPLVQAEVYDTHSTVDVSGGATLAVSTTIVNALAGGAKLYVQEKLERSVKWDGVEIHVSKSSGFTPNSTTLMQVTKSDAVELQGLEPGTTYYAKAVTRLINDGRPVIGSISAEVSFVAGYSNPNLQNPLCDYGSLIPNGDFEASSVASGLPDGWIEDPATGCQWGFENFSNSGELSTGFNGAKSVSFGDAAPASGRPARFISKGFFSVDPNATYRMHCRVYANGTGSAGSAYLRVSWYTGADVLVSSTDLDLKDSTGGVFVQKSLVVTAPATAQKAKIVVGRFTTSGGPTKLQVDAIRFDRAVEELANPITVGRGDVRVDLTGSSSGTPRRFGFWGFASGNNGRYTFGDDGSGLQSGFGNRVQLYAYHNLELYGRQGGAVPAFNAGGVGAGGTARPVIIQQEAWQTPTLLNSWVNYDTTGFTAAGYMMDANGMVHLRGLIKNGTLGPAVACFNLPAAYRPTRQLHFPVASNGAFGVCAVATNGDVLVQSGSNVWFSLDVVRFIPTL